MCYGMSHESESAEPEQEFFTLWILSFFLKTYLFIYFLPEITTPWLFILNEFLWIFSRPEFLLSIRNRWRIVSRWTDSRRKGSTTSLTRFFYIFKKNLFRFVFLGPFRLEKVPMKCDLSMGLKKKTSKRAHLTQRALKFPSSRLRLRPKVPAC